MLWPGDRHALKERRHNRAECRAGDVRDQIEQARVAVRRVELRQFDGGREQCAQHHRSVETEERQPGVSKCQVRGKPERHIDRDVHDHVAKQKPPRFGVPGVQQDVERIAGNSLRNEVPRIQRSVDEQKSDQDKNASQNSIVTCERVRLVDSCRNYWKERQRS